MDTLTIAAWLGTKIGPGGMKQATVAREIDVRQSMVSRWLRGEAMPAPENCRRLARLFGESETAVLAMAGHLSSAGGPSPQRSLADLATELAARIRDLPPIPDGHGTSGLFPGSHGSGTIGSIQQRRSSANRDVSSPAALLDLIGQPGGAMPEAEHVNVTIVGDWLLPDIKDGERLELNCGGPGTLGDHVIARLADRVVTGWLTGLDYDRRLTIDGGGTISAADAVTLAVIVGRVTDERLRADRPSD